MTDEHDDQGQGDDPADDGRDERMAALLDVPPLDDVTRRRLVRHAVDATGPSRSRRRVFALTSTAAVLVAVLVTVGVALSSGDEGTTTAARGRPDPLATTTQPQPSADSESTKSPGPAPSVPGATEALPDLGELGDAQTLAARVRAELRQDRAAAGAGVAVPCASTLGDDGIHDVVVVGRGTDDGRPVVVVSGTRGGDRVAVSILPDPCEVARLAVL